MLDLDRSLSIAGVSLFRDHLDEATFHYLPGQPRLASAGDLSLLLYRGTQNGGLLSLQVDLDHPKGLIDRIAAELGNRAGRAVSLVPVLFHAGRVQLLLPGVSEGLTPARVVGTATPSLLGHQRAMFNIVMPEALAVLVRNALEPGQPSFLAAAYELTFSGLERSRDVVVEVDYHRVHEALAARGAVGSLWLRADAAAAVERLIMDQHVRIEDVSREVRDAEASAARAAELHALVKELVEQVFFEREHVATAADAGGVAGPLAIGLRLRALRSDEAQTLRYDRRETGLRDRTIAPQGQLVIPEEALGERIREVEASLFFSEPRPFTVYTSGDWTGAARAVVDVRQGEREVSLSLSADAPQDSLLLPPGARQLRVQVFAADEEDLLAAPASDTAPAWRDFDGWNFALDPQRELGRRTVAIELVAIDPALTEAVVTLRAEEATCVLRLDAAQPRQRQAVRAPGALSLQASLRLEPPGGLAETVVIEEEVGPSQALVLIRPPADRIRCVTAALADPLRRFEAVIVELARMDGSARRALRLSADAPQASWSYVRDDDDGGFQWRERKLLRGGLVEEGAWQPSTAQLLVAGDPQVRLLGVDVLLLGDADHLGGTLLVEPLAPPEGVAARVERLLDAGQNRALVSVASADGGGVRVEAELFTAGGDSIRFGPLETHDSIAVLSPAAPP